MVKRRILKYLNTWKNTPKRQVLLLRGARQVGKTFIVREFGKSFDNFLEINFLENQNFKKLFAGGELSPDKIIPKLEAYFGVNLIPGKSLLFLDEIQASEEALMALRFFTEKIPELHVVAAGSLLEFALRELPSFGVGRITSLFMYPLSFSEFLEASAEENLLKFIIDAKNRTLDEVIHKKCLELYKVYSIIGGMPQVVASFIEENNFNRCMQLIDSIILGFQDDFAKYKTRIDPQKLRAVFTSSAMQAGKKFMFTKVIEGESTVGFSNALELLVLAGIIIKINRSSANGIPLGAEIDTRNFKCIPLDIGIYNRLMSLSLSELMIKEPIVFINNGAQAEVFAGLEIIKNQDPYLREELFYWGREEKGSQAEVDYLIQKKREITPIEIKAGTKGQMQSLYRFMLEKDCRIGIRSSLENFGEMEVMIGDQKRFINIIPLYWLGEWSRQ